ncbi:hypothetical protein ES703_67544 [subsurface metagenome]
MTVIVRSEYIVTVLVRALDKSLLVPIHLAR